MKRQNAWFMQEEKHMYFLNKIPSRELWTTVTSRVTEHHVRPNMAHFGFPRFYMKIVLTMFCFSIIKTNPRTASKKSYFSERKKINKNQQFEFGREFFSNRPNHAGSQTWWRKCTTRKVICSALFLDVAQAVDIIWHKGPVNESEWILPKQYAQILKSYITERLFKTKQDDEYPELKTVSNHAEVIEIKNHEIVENC